MIIRKISAVIVAAVVLASTLCVFPSAGTTVYDAKDGFGIKAAYGPFQLMYSLEHGDIWKLLADLHNLEDTYTTVYKGEGVSDWNFKTVNGEMCANATSSSSVVKFVAPAKGDYTLLLKVHCWNRVLGVISVVGRKTNGDMIWNSDYRPTSTNQNDAASATFSLKLGKGDEVFIWIRETAEITIDTMTFSVTSNSESSSKETTKAPETTKIPETTKAPETTKIPETTEIPDTSLTETGTEPPAAETEPGTEESIRPETSETEPATASAPASDGNATAADTPGAPEDGTGEADGKAGNKKFFENPVWFGIAVAEAAVIAVLLFIKKGKKQ